MIISLLDFINRYNVAIKNKNQFFEAPLHKNTKEVIKILISLNFVLKIEKNNNNENFKVFLNFINCKKLKNCSKPRWNFFVKKKKFLNILKNENNIYIYSNSKNQIKATTSIQTTSGGIILFKILW